MVLSWVGCSASRLVALVSVGAGGAGAGNPFVEVEAEVTTFGPVDLGERGQESVT